MARFDHRRSQDSFEKRVVVFFPLRFDPSIHLGKEVVQYGLSISRRLGLDLEIICFGTEGNELPLGIYCHDLSTGKSNLSHLNNAYRMVCFAFQRRHQIPVFIAFFWGYWAWFSVPLIKVFSPGIIINKLDGNPRRILDSPNLGLFNLKKYLETAAIFIYSKFVDIIGCESVALQAAMQTKYSSNDIRKKLHYIPSGVTSSFIEECKMHYPRKSLENGRIKVLFLGRVNEPFKGIEVFLNAIPLTSTRQIDFVVCGQSGKWSDEVFRNFFIDHPDCRDKINVIEKIAGERRIAELLAEVDVLCLTSFDTKLAVESFGLVLVEAICSGVYFVASDTVPSAVDLIGNAFGETFNSGDSQDLAKKLDAIANDTNRLAAVRANGLAQAHRLYSWDVIAKNTLALIGQSESKS
jgi:glycosyltransferase involved in cell wall biosynthesis